MQDNKTLVGLKVKMLYDFPLDNEIFEITDQKDGEIEVTGDFAAMHNLKQSQWDSQKKIKEFV